MVRVWAEGNTVYIPDQAGVCFIKDIDEVTGVAWFYDDNGNVKKCRIEDLSDDIFKLCIREARDDE